MPCYLFTFHSYGSWLPDRKRGFVKRHRGILAPDAAMASKYRLVMKETAVEFSNDIQRVCIDAILESQDTQEFEAFFVATDPTHVHALVGWRDERPWLHMRRIIKTSLTRTLNTRLHPRTWLAEGGSRKRLKDRAHFDYLVQQYLPQHRGWKWSPERGTFR
jgi:hypothetical protein